MLMCNEKITLIQHVKEADTDKYIPIVIDGASWFGKVKISPSDSGAAHVVEVTVRVPADKMPENVVPKVGDYIKRGETLQEEMSFEEFSTTEEVFKLLNVGDNRRGKLSHWRLSGA